jgi:hypothetical protein
MSRCETVFSQALGVVGGSAPYSIGDFEESHPCVVSALALESVAVDLGSEVSRPVAMKEGNVIVVLLALVLEGEPKLGVEAIQFEAPEPGLAAGLRERVARECFFECCSDEGLSYASVHGMPRFPGIKCDSRKGRQGPYTPCARQGLAANLSDKSGARPHYVAVAECAAARVCTHLWDEAVDCARHHAKRNGWS